MLFEKVAEYYSKLEGISSRLDMIDVLTDMLKESGKDEIRELIYMTQGALAPAFEGLNLGMAERLVENAISVATGFDDKSVVANYKKSGDLGTSAEFFVKSTKLRRMTKSKYTVREVYETMKKIATTSGQGSVDTKVKMLANLIASSSPVEARYAVRFALGQLRLGLGDATILEALSKMATGDRKAKAELENAYNICSDLGKVGESVKKDGINGIKNFKVLLFSPIRPALAERLPTAEEILSRMGGKCSVESKYDGFRCQVHIDKKTKHVEIFSRNLERTTAMFPDITKAALEEIDAKEAILEGEALAYDDVTQEFHSFQETIQRKRKHGIDEISKSLPLHLFAFDLLYLNGEDCLGKPYHERREKLEAIIKKAKLILPSDRIIATKASELEGYFEKQIENGLEGIVAKDLNARYIAGARKFSWIKLKRSYKGELEDTIDLVIVGYYLGRGMRAEFKFGGLLCATYNKKLDVFETITKIGTGFTENMMSMFQKTLDKIKTKTKPARVDAFIEPDFWVTPKYVVTVRADEITKSPMHTCGRNGTSTGYALRFPRIISDGYRSDKGPEETTTSQEIVEMFGQQKRTKVE